MDYEDIREEEIKLALLGEASVGKTSILNRFMERDFNSNELNTIGIEQSRKKLELKLENQIIISTLKIYDSAGQERYKSIALNYIKQVDGIILIYDISNKESFKCLYNWVKKIKENTNKEVKMIVVGNKIDLGKNVIEENEINEILNCIKKEGYDTLYLESSAKENYNIEQIFNSINEKIIKHRLKYGRERSPSFVLKNYKNNDNNQEILTKKIDINKILNFFYSYYNF